MLDERLAEVDAAIDDFKAQGLMSALGAIVLNPGVGGYLGTTLFLRPLFRGAHEGAANSLPAEVFVDEPAFDESDRAGDITAVGVRADAYFDKTGNRVVSIFGYEDSHGHRAISAGAKNGVKFFAMFFASCFGPQKMMHRCEVAEVGGSSLSDRGRQLVPSGCENSVCRLKGYVRSSVSKAGSLRPSAEMSRLPPTRVFTTTSISSSTSAVAVKAPTDSGIPRLSSNTVA